MTTLSLPEPPDATTAWPGVDPFAPRRGLGNGHLMTVFAWAARREFLNLPAVDTRLVQVSADTTVRADCYWQPKRTTCRTLLALHGLEGSSAVHYMRGLASKAYAAGWNAVLLNQRNCGGTEHLTPGLYHSGLTDDPRAVIRALADSDGLSDVVVVGYSLGGNLAAKLAAELDDHPDIPVRAAVAVCPTMDLDRCVRALERRANVVYHLNFVRNLRARMRRKAAAWPGLYDLTPLDSIWSIRRFDDVYTAPHHGFGDAANYYRLASAARVADRVRVPLLILAADDDPFVPPDQFRAAAIVRNPNIRVTIAARGGHCAFVAAPGAGAHADDGYWAEMQAIRFLAAHG